MRNDWFIVLAVMRRIENRLDDLFKQMEDLTEQVRVLGEEGVRVTLQVASDEGEEEEEVEMV
jgi:hypothetical protein